MRKKSFVEANGHYSFSNRYSKLNNTYLILKKIKATNF